MTLELALFYLVAAGAVLTALAMIMARDVVHAALFMIANFVLTAALYLMLQAAFVAAVQVMIYAGAIMVLFLFVVMLLGGGRAALDEPLVGQRPLGALLLVILGSLLIAVTARGVPAAPPGGIAAPELPVLPGGFGSPQAVGAVLFREHVLTFEIVSVLLLVAMIGAVVIALYRPEAGEERSTGEEEGG